MTAFNCLGCKSSGKDYCDYHRGFIDGQKKKISDAFYDEFEGSIANLTVARAHIIEANNKILEIRQKIRFNNRVIAEENKQPDLEDWHKPRNLRPVYAERALKEEEKI